MGVLRVHQGIQAIQFVQIGISAHGIRASDALESFGLRMRVARLQDVQRLLTLRADSISAHVDWVAVALLPFLATNTATNTSVHFLQAEVSPLHQERLTLFPKYFIFVFSNVRRDAY